MYLLSLKSQVVKVSSRLQATSHYIGSLFQICQQFGRVIFSSFAFKALRFGFVESYDSWTPVSGTKKGYGLIRLLHSWCQAHDSSALSKLSKGGDYST